MEDIRFNDGTGQLGKIEEKPQTLVANKREWFAVVDSEGNAEGIGDYPKMAGLAELLEGQQHEPYRVIIVVEKE